MDITISLIIAMLCCADLMVQHSMRRRERYDD
jgi:hypothetical protein